MTATNVETNGRRNTPFSRMRELWGWLRSRSSTAEPAALTHDQLRLARATFQECLDGIGGEASARHRVGTIAELYANLNDEGRRELLRMLVSEFGVDDEQVAAAVRSYLDGSGAERRRAQTRLRVALSSPRIKILKHFNLLPDGVKFLVDLRADVLRYVRSHPELEVLDEELFGLLGSWFDVGNLELRRISWNSPASLLEKLITYEAVHEIRSWSDLRKRMDSDRRCYAFFHPRMPDEPLVFVEIALVQEMASSVQVLLDEATPAADPRAATAAIFYSISSTQNGLRGVSFGGFLIKRVAEQLISDFPRLRTFATLSPIPGFRRWLETRLNARESDLFDTCEPKALAALTGSNNPHEVLSSALGRDFLADEVLTQKLEPILTSLCARYLVQEMEEDAPRPIDPVARFHLGNGAQLERLNWLADRSARGLKQAAGLMVNYLYRLDDIEVNHEAYEREGKIAISRGVRKLLRNRD
ncbi:MAG: malonyl-CoA decarboxylase [Burkholderiales bacterium]